MKKQQINGEPLEFTGNVMMKQLIFLQFGLENSDQPIDLQYGGDPQMIPQPN
jgi:hypothetical protein